VNSNATILDDGETVEFLRDRPDLLAIADAVRATQTRSATRRRLASRRTRVGFGLAAVAAGAAIAAGVALTAQKAASPQHLFRGKSLVQPPPTLARPLGLTGTKIPLSDAARTLGGPVVLPNSSLANSSNLGSVWERTVPGHEYDLAITFPSAGIIVQYDRPVPYPEPPAEMYQTEARQQPDSMSAIDLNGVPALATQQNSDQLGTNFGSIEFVKGGTRIAVLGHYDEATLESIAQSIVEQ
jgi:hypothetical protein